MIPEQFFAEFAHIADAPNGVQKLRELILQLAVRGKLVQQDPNDEPAARLLERIQAEKAKLIKEKKIRKSDPLPPVSDDEAPYEVPNGWKWVRLRDVSRDCGQKVPDKRFTYIDVSAVDNAKGKIAQPTILEADDAPSRARKLVEIGTVIYSTVRPYLLNIAVINEPIDPVPIASTAFAIVHPLGNISSQYLFWWLRSPDFIAFVESKMLGVAYPAINDSQFFAGPFPLPPLSEQHRIVAKVDQLMALCDELETKQAKKQQKLTRLNNSAIDRLLTTREQAEFSEAWGLIRDNFDLIYTTPDTISKLRQAILQLAVQGKLVHQDPNDEPASALLAKIKAEKERLVKEKIIRKSDPLPPVSADEAPYELPQGWEWVRLENICEVITKGSSPKWQGINYVDSDKGILFVTSENVGNFCLRLDDPKYVEAKFNEIEPRSILKKYDVLMNIVGASIGRTAIFDIEAVANINQAVCLIRFVAQKSFVDLKFMLNFFNSTTCVSYMFDKQVDNARANLSMGNIAKFAIPFPPLAEQHRIVAKVNCLMTLCDEIESRMTKSQSKSEKLTAAAVQSLLAA